MGLVAELVAARGRPLVMGILNATPDSFYAATRAVDPKLALARAHEMMRDGADILDVGGESTRPGSEPVSEEDELARVVPVVAAIRDELDVPISIDTRRARVAEAALAAGARIVNDVSAGRDDARMFDVVAVAGADVVLMHMQGTPRTMQKEPRYDDVVGEVSAFLLERAKAAERAGISRDRIVLDPGIGFGKRLDDNLALLGATRRVADLGYPLLVGASRKSMFEAMLGRAVEERLTASLAVAAFCALNGASVLRVHDVKETLDVVRVVQSLRETRA